LKEQCNFETHIAVNLKDSEKDAYLRDAADYHDIEVVSALDAHDGARAYLSRRGVSAQDIVRYAIGYTTQAGRMEHRLLFPVREYYSQAMWGYVGRKWRGPPPSWMASFTTPVICGFRRHDSTVHVVVEGMLDAIKVNNSGTLNVACMLGTSKLVLMENWAARIPPDEHIVLMLDGDAKEKQEKLRWRLNPIHPVRIAAVPEHVDPGDLEPSALSWLINTVMSEAST
jgi:DNA primase